eukprot:TRINITY_DN428_c0_g1_i5.p1 TRINITY_DN428_c0_g1~~TRINITY_DN428_c0_g1_i5.p1  ORF type:complete len:376 (-),score=44.12 TRINITY_DN428_c0_g1_i5:302-1429(-)
MPSEFPSNQPTSSPESSEPTFEPSEAPSVKPSEAPTFGPSFSMPTKVPSGAPSVAPVTTLSPTDLPTSAPTEVCVTFTLSCAFGPFDGSYTRVSGWRMQYARGDGFTLETGFVFNEIRWVFQGQGESSILISEYFDNGFDLINQWSLVDASFTKSENQCTIMCSATNTPTASPTLVPTSTAPTEMPVTALPTKAPSATPSTSPTDAPVTAEPTTTPSTAPLASSPSRSPSVAPTTPCLSFSMTCSSPSAFDGTYAYDAWTRSWVEGSSSDEFSVTIFPTGLHWVFESISTSQLLVSSTYEHNFAAIEEWTLQDRFDLSRVILFSAHLSVVRLTLLAKCPLSLPPLSRPLRPPLQSQHKNRSMSLCWRITSLATRI